MKIDGRNIEITHPNKILFPKSGITKRHLIDYYIKISDTIIPYLANRPLTLKRFPEGIDTKGFFQKNVSDHVPDWISTVKIEKQNGWVEHVNCTSKSTLIYLVNQDTISFHVTLSTKDHIKYPDKIIFDIDPKAKNFKMVTEGAQIIKHFFESEFGMKTFVMTTGSRGLHISVPIIVGHSFDEVRQFTKKVALYLTNLHPKLFTSAHRKEKRQGRLYLDYARNSYAQTAISPYSVRPYQNAPVATPISWEELEDPVLTSKSFTIKNLDERINTLPDPWLNYNASRNFLDRPIQIMHNLELVATTNAKT